MAILRVLVSHKDSGAVLFDKPISWMHKKAMVGSGDKEALSTLVTVFHQFANELNDGNPTQIIFTGNGVANTNNISSIDNSPRGQPGSGGDSGNSSLSSASGSSAALAVNAPVVPRRSSQLKASRYNLAKSSGNSFTFRPDPEIHMVCETFGNIIISFFYDIYSDKEVVESMVQRAGNSFIASYSSLMKSPKVLEILTSFSAENPIPLPPQVIKEFSKFKSELDVIMDVH